MSASQVLCKLHWMNLSWDSSYVEILLKKFILFTVSTSENVMILAIVSPIILIIVMTSRQTINQSRSASFRCNICLFSPWYTLLTNSCAYFHIVHLQFALNRYMGSIFPLCLLKIYLIEGISCRFFIAVNGKYF